MDKFKKAVIEALESIGESVGVAIHYLGLALVAWACGHLVKVFGFTGFTAEIFEGIKYAILIAEGFSIVLRIYIHMLPKD